MKKQTISLPFGGGLDTKTDPFLVESPNILELENGVYRKGGTIQKRSGLVSLPNSIFGTSDVINSGSSLTTFDNDLVLLSQNNLYSFASGSTTWFQKGRLSPITAKNINVFRDGTSQFSPDLSITNGVVLSAYQTDISGGVSYTIIDESSGSAILTNKLIDSNGITPQVVNLGNNFLVFYGTTVNELKVLRVNSSTFEEETFTIAGDFEETDPVISVRNIQNNQAVIVYKTTADSLKLERYQLISGGLTATASSTLTQSDSVLAAEVFDDIDNLQIYCVYSRLNEVRLQGTYQTLDAQASDNVQLFTTTNNVSHVTGVANSPTDITIYAEEISPSSPQFHKIHKAKVTYNSGTTPPIPGPSEIFQRGVGLGSKAFSRNGTNFVLAVNQSQLQPSYYLLRDDSPVEIVSKLLSQVAGGHLETSTLPEVVLTSSGEFSTLLRETSSLSAEDGTILVNKGIVKTSLSFSVNQFNSDQLGKNLLIGSGFVLDYDGNQVVEHGFNTFPEGVVISEGPAGPLETTGTNPNNLYAFRVMYEWTDSRGQIHRSAPSVSSGPVGTSTGSFSLTVPTLKLSKKERVFIVVYRTLNTRTGGGTIFYRTESVPNDPSVDTITIEDNNEDTVIRTNEILYTTGGVVENIAPPTASIVHRHQNRIFIAGLEEDNEIWYSKESVKGEGVGFSDFFRIRVNPAGGPITALGTLDDKLIIFKENSIFALSGQGPLATGQQNDYQQPEEVSSDTGSLEPNSIVIVPSGLMFNSGKGIKLLSRSLAVEDVGAAVERFENSEVTSAITVPEADEVRFTTRDNLCLVYNYYFNRWTTFTNYEANSATSWLGRYLILKNNGKTLQDTSGVYSDEGSPIKLRILTSWMSFANLIGYKRLHQLILLGRNVSNHILQINMYYNFSSQLTDTIYFNTLESLNQEAIPQDVIAAGFETLVGNKKSEVYQFRIRPRIQKCESFQLEFVDIPVDGVYGPSYELSALNALVAVKPGSPDIFGTALTRGSL